MRRFKRNLQTFAENIRKFAAYFQKICPKKPGTLNRYVGNSRAGIHRRCLWSQDGAERYKPCALCSAAALRSSALLTRSALVLAETHS